MSSESLLDTRQLATVTSGPSLPDVPGHRILGQVATGGMAVIYAAIREQTEQRVAIKLVWPDQHGQIAAERLGREIEVLRALDHPGIVSYIDHGITARAQPFMVMEWLDGVDLEARLRSGRMSIDDALALTLGVSEALACAHTHGVVHRDLKPANIFLVGDEPTNIRVLDFGIARADESLPTLTLPGRVVGTPSYMSPEQARSERALDARTDLFSLGCVLYECLCGARAFTGEHVMAVLAKILMDRPRPASELLPQIPRAVDDLLAHLLEKDPAQRISSAAELSRRLQVVATDLSAQPPPRTEVLTHHEQALHSVLFIRGESAKSVPLTRLTSEDLGQLVTLADGTRLIVMNRRGVASDQAASAALCALGLHRRSANLAIAVASGHGMVTGRSIIGKVLDRGAALLQHAGPHVIRIDEVTTSLLDARFEIGGDEQGLTLLSVQDGQPRLRRLMGKATPLVGRRRELAFLEEAFAESVEERGTTAIVVVGEAGAGKTRLRHELEARLRARAEHSVTTLIGRADPMYTQAPFSVLARLIHRAAGLRDGEPTSVQRQKLSARLSRYVSADDVHQVTLYLGELVGAFHDDAPLELVLARETSAALRARIEQALCRWLRAECSAGPVLLVLEDLHWADAATVRVFDEVLGQLDDAPLLVLALARPSLFDRFDSLWDQRDVERMDLPPLSPRAARSLVEQVLGDSVAPDAVERVVSSARGNAFFLEELMRAIAEGSEDELPDSVLGMMQARLRALTTQERQVLRAVSVFGQTAWRGGVRELLGPEASTLDALLVRLTQAEWLTHQAHSQIPGEDEYTFRHSLAADAAYATLLDADRRVGHRLAGRWLEQAGNREPIVLAEHFVRGEEDERAVAWFAAAADQAFERHEFDAVQQIVDRGLALETEGNDTGRLLLRKAEVCAVAGQHQDAADTALAALDHLSLDSVLWYCAAGEAALAIGRSGQTDRVLEMVDRLMEMEVIGDGGAAHFAGLVQAALPLAAAGEAQAAERLLDKIIYTMSTLVEDDPGAWGPLYSARGLRAVVRGQLDTAVHEMNSAATAYERSGQVRTALEHTAGAGFFLFELGELPRAEKTLRSAIDRASELRLEHLCAVARHNLGQRVAEMGRIEEGLALEELALESFARHGNTRMMGLTRCHLAAILLLDGRTEHATALANEALELLADHAASRAIARAIRARILMKEDENEAAFVEARAAIIDLESVVRVQEGESMIRLTWAQALVASERPEEAKEAIAAARRSLDDRAARLETDVARVCFLHRVPENRSIVELASEWFESGGEGSE